MTKAQYRNKFLELRSRADSEFMKNASAAFSRILFLSDLYHDISERTVMVYSSFKSEADTSLIIADLIESGAKVILPKVDGVDLIPCYYTGPSCLQGGSFGIMEPNPEICEICDPYSIDIVIAPGLAFDINGSRLGFGKGYYDRFLQKVRKDTLKIGLCYGFQLITGDELPAEHHDIPMDYILTEDGFFNCKTHSYTSL